MQGIVVTELFYENIAHMWRYHRIVGWKSTSRHTVHKSGVKKTKLPRCCQKCLFTSKTVVSMPTQYRLTQPLVTLHERNLKHVYNKRLCQVEVKLKFKICYRPRAFNYKKCLGQVVTTVTKLGRFVPMAQPVSSYNCNNARAVRTDGSASE